jgi:ribosomal protein L37AE/L43A
MKIRKRKYKCTLCKKTILRISDKQWIKSMCGIENKMTRLILIHKK